jgi:nitronate monooxygenase
MKSIIPKIIQGGMGAGLSDWRLAQAVSRVGQLGVVSGTGLDQIMARRLQEGDLGGHIRRALASFPFPKMAHRILEACYIPGGKAADAPYSRAKMNTIIGEREAQELCIAANFVEVTLARENHTNPVGINFLEKIQLPHLPSLYGAMLAGAAVVIIGAGIPLEVPGVLDALANHEATSYPMYIGGAAADGPVRLTFDPKAFWEEPSGLPALERPDFLPIVASEALAKVLARKSTGEVAGFVIEGPTAGGHNAPPRGSSSLSDDGEPIYGSRDMVNLDAVRKLGLPFWLAGGYGTPDRLQEALDAGAAGVQVGTAFALCAESALVKDIRLGLISEALRGDVSIFTDPKASPTGFPFKVVNLPDTLSDDAIYGARKRVCDIGFLREAYRKEDGSIGYRCAAEPEAAYVAKGGKLEDSVGCRCLCNALVANIGMPQILSDGSLEPCLVTLGDDLSGVTQFCTSDHPEFTAEDVVRVLLGA